MSSPSVAAFNSDRDIQGGRINEVMKADMVRKVKEMGFDDSVIRSAMKQKLQRSEQYSSVNELLDDIITSDTNIDVPEEETFEVISAAEECKLSAPAESNSDYSDDFLSAEEVSSDCETAESSPDDNSADENTFASTNGTLKELSANSAAQPKQLISKDHIRLVQDITLPSTRRIDERVQKLKYQAHHIDKRVKELKHQTQNELQQNKERQNQVENELRQTKERQKQVENELRQTKEQTKEWQNQMQNELSRAKEQQNQMQSELRRTKKQQNQVQSHIMQTTEQQNQLQNKIMQTKRQQNQMQTELRRTKKEQKQLKSQLRRTAERQNQLPNTSRQGREEEDHQKCTICFDKPVNVAFDPCGHTSCCNVCAQGLSKKDNGFRNCPICRKRINNIIRIYTA